MNEREYVKVNTSIQTGSNANQLIRNDEGNVEATIELRLPQNLFDDNGGTRTITQVDLKTSKMRLSLAETPIAKIPLDTDLSNLTIKRAISTMQLDIYPFCLLDDGSFYPDPSRSDIIATMKYKNKAITVQLRDTATFTIMKQWFGYANDLVNPLPDDVIAQCLDDAGVGIMHLMNVCVQGNHEPLRVDESGTSLYIRNLGTLEQCLQDAIENAVTYAYTSSTTRITIDMKPSSADDPKAVEISGFGYYVYDRHTIDSSPTCELLSSFKPIVKINEQSLSISFDSAAFADKVPIIWSPAYVNTNDHPSQLTIDEFRKSVWQAPPVKRAYRYPVIWNSDNSWGYSIPTTKAMCAPINIIVNKEFRDVFSFLPWIPLNIPPAIDETPSTSFEGYTVTKKESWERFTATSPEDYRYIFLDRSTSAASCPAYLATGGLNMLPAADVFNNRAYVDYTFKVHDGDDPNDVSKRYDQSVDIGNITWAETTTQWMAPIWVQYIADATPVDNCRLASSVITSDGVWPNPSHEAQNELLSRQATGGYIAFKGVLDLKGPPTTESGKKFTHGIERHSNNGQGGSDTMRLVTYNWGGSWSSESDCYMPTPYIWDYDEVEVATFSGGTTYHCRLHCYDVYQLKSGIVWYSSTLLGVLYMRDTTSVYGNAYPAHPDFNPELNKNPNLLSTDMYLLDGTPANVNIEQPELVFNNSAVGKCVFKTSEEWSLATRYAVGLNENPTVYETPPTTAPMYVRSDENEIVYTASAKTNSVIVNNTFTAPVYMDVMYSFDSTNNTWDGLCQNQGSFSSVTVAFSPTITVVSLSVSSITTTKVEIHAPVLGTLSPYETSTRTIEEHTEYYYASDAMPTDGSTVISSSSTYSDGGVRTEPAFPDGVSAPDFHVMNCRLVAFDESPPYAYFPDHTYEIKSSCFWNDSLEGTEFDTGIPRLDYNDPTLRRFYTITQDGATTTYTFRIALKYWLAGSQRYAGNPNLRLTGRIIHGGATKGTDYSQMNGLPYIIYDRKTTKSIVESRTASSLDTSIAGNERITFTWSNLPMVVMSPIQSIVLSLEGIHVSQEYYPVNITQPTGSSLTSTIPVIENYYSLATTLRDLHDELIVTKDEFDDTATYKVSLTGGEQRSIRLSAKYVDKDGTLHQIYIPPNGVFSLQLTFGLSYYVSSGI